VSTLLTVLWILPALVQRNLVLGNLIDVNSSFFAAVWLSSLCITAGTWVFFKWRAQGEELFQRALNLESTQNWLFNSFLKNHARLKREIERYYSYTRSLGQREDEKREVISYIARNPLYHSLRRNDEYGFGDQRTAAIADVEEWVSAQRRFGSYEETEENEENEFSKADFVSYVGSRSIDVKGSVAARTGKHWLLRRLFFSRELIDDELAHKVADLVLTRAEAKGIVSEIESPTLDQHYSYRPRSYGLRWR